MALHHRKLLPQESSAPKHASSSCYFCYVCPKDCYDLVSPPPLIQPLHPQNHKKLTIILILILSVLSAAFLFLSYLTVSNHRSRRARTPRAIGLEPILDHPARHVRTTGLTQSAIDSIPTLLHQKGMPGKGDCSVCLNEFQENETLRLLPKCSHAFHVPCIDTWLRSHKNCPICRGPVVLDAGGSEASLGLEGSVSTGENVIEMENSSVHALSRSGFMDDESRVGVVSDLSDRGSGLGREFGKHVRRPVSLDFTIGSIGSDSYREVVSRDEGCSGDRIEMVDEPIFEDVISKRGSNNRTIKSSGSGRSLEKMPISMKRSFSCSGKRSFRRNSRSIEAISIQEICEQNRSQSLYLT